MIKQKKGITLLLAILISSLILTLGIGVFTLLFSEIKISEIAKESFIAFYAADSGIECAIFWDTAANAFSTSSTFSINCDGDTFIVGGSSGVSSFTIPFDNGSCTEVRVTKGVETVITSQGRNTCAPSSITVQRGLRVNY